MLEDLEELSNLKLIWVDGGYSGPNFSRVVDQLCNAQVEVIQKTESGFQILPRRWVVERTFSWFMGCRRLVVDYETRSSCERGSYLHRNDSTHGTSPCFLIITL